MESLFLFREKQGMDFDELRDYSNTLEELLESKFKKFNQVLEKRAKKVPQEELEDFYSDHYYDRLIEGMSSGYELNYRYPDLLRKSVFTTCYAFFELELTNYCKFIKTKNNIELALFDLKHEGITKAQVFLKKVAGIAFPDSKIDWSNIINYNRIRNSIMHNNGFISDNPKDKTAGAVRNFIKENPRIISVDAENQVELSRGFSMEFLKTTESFLHELYGPTAFKAVSLFDRDIFNE